MICAHFLMLAGPFKQTGGQKGGKGQQGIVTHWVIEESISL
jgi:hypothetical protein